MKICFLCNYPLNELRSKYIIRLGELLNEANNEVIIITQENQYFYQLAIQKELSILPITQQEEGLTMRTTYQLNQALQMESPHVLMVFNKESISTGVLLKKVALSENAKLVFFQTEVFNEKQKSFWTELKDTLWDGKMLKLIDNWIAPLEVGDKFFQKYPNLAKEKVKCIFPQLRLQYQGEIQASKQALKIPTDETLIALVVDRNLLDDAISLINVIAKLRNKGYEANGVILLSESGIYSSKRLALYQHAIDKKVEHHIEILFKGQVQEQDLIHLADILLICEPALFRTLEAFSAGTPTILSKHKVNTLLNERGDLGLMSAFNSKKLTKKIREYLDDDLLAEIISTKGEQKMGAIEAEKEYVAAIQQVLDLGDKLS